MFDRTRRFLDVLLVWLLAPVAIPLVGILALAVALETRRSPWFRQFRVGLNGQTFEIIKLETFQEHPLTFSRSEEIDVDDPRLTRSGRFLRRYKLDEIPQLLNVLRGDMSIIGPRPDLPAQAVDYDGIALERLNIRPGLTGLVQVSGNSRLSWEQRFVLDSWYVRNRSLWLDLRILLATPLAILRGEAGHHDPLNVHRLLRRQSCESADQSSAATSR